MSEIIDSHEALRKALREAEREREREEYRVHLSLERVEVTQTRRVNVTLVRDLYELRDAPSGTIACAREHNARKWAEERASYYQKKHERAEAAVQQARIDRTAEEGHARGRLAIERRRAERAEAALATERAAPHEPPQKGDG